MKKYKIFDIIPSATGLRLYLIKEFDFKIDAEIYLSAHPLIIKKGYNITILEIYV